MQGGPIFRVEGRCRCELGRRTDASQKVECFRKEAHPLCLVHQELREVCPLCSTEEPCKASSTDASKDLLLLLLLLVLAIHPGRAL